jgi:hypothetical protein
VSAITTVTTHIENLKRWLGRKTQIVVLYLTACQMQPPASRSTSDGDLVLFFYFLVLLIAWFFIADQFFGIRMLP